MVMGYLHTFTAGEQIKAAIADICEIQTTVENKGGYKRRPHSFKKRIFLGFFVNHAVRFICGGAEYNRG